jgi:hypothetical protein
VLLASQTPGTTELIFGLLAYGSLFAVTIRQYRENRAVVLGVLTVSAFFGFLLLASLSQKHAPFWLLASVAVITVLTGLVVLSFVAVGVWNWAMGRSK